MNFLGGFILELVKVSSNLIGCVRPAPANRKWCLPRRVTYDLPSRFTRPQELARNIVKTPPKHARNPKRYSNKSVNPNRNRCMVPGYKIRVQFTRRFSLVAHILYGHLPISHPYSHLQLNRAQRPQNNSYIIFTYLRHFLLSKQIWFLYYTTWILSKRPSGCVQCTKNSILRNIF